MVAVHLDFRSLMNIHDIFECQRMQAKCLADLVNQLDTAEPFYVDPRNVIALGFCSHQLLDVSRLQFTRVAILFVVLDHMDL